MEKEPLLTVEEESFGEGGVRAKSAELIQGIARNRIAMACALVLSLLSAPRTGEAQAPPIDSAGDSSAANDKIEQFVSAFKMAKDAYGRKDFAVVVSVLDPFLNDSTLGVPPSVVWMYMDALATTPTGHQKLKALCNREREEKFFSKRIPLKPDHTVDKKGYADLLESYYIPLLVDSIDAVNGLYFLVEKYLIQLPPKPKGSYSPGDVFKLIAKDSRDVKLLVMGLEDMQAFELADIFIAFCFEVNPALQKDKTLKDMAQSLEGVAKEYLKAKGKARLEPGPSRKALTDILAVSGFKFKE